LPTTQTLYPARSPSPASTAQASAISQDAGRRLAPPAPLTLPWTSELAVSATVTPSCVRPGSSARLDVKTIPKAGIAYLAQYSGNRSGGPPPLGDGLGGNDTGSADRHGTFSASWIVSPAAPEGAARADVIVSYGGKWGYAGASFVIADHSHACVP
jgi:hypothetical protein